MDVCLHCSTPLKKRRKLRNFCSFKCSSAMSGRKAQNRKKRDSENSDLRSRKRAFSLDLTFARVNAVTIRIDSPKKRAVGWLMEVNWPGGRSSERWVACVKNHRSEPLPLEIAKTAAREFLATRRRGEDHDLVTELNDYHAEAVKDAEPLLNISDDPPVTKDDWRYIVETECGGLPVIKGRINGIFDTKAELEAYQREHRANLHHVEIETYEDGYPKLPSFLDRRRKFAEAA